jgi:rhodanese-related sulfurtransferase
VRKVLLEGLAVAAAGAALAFAANALSPRGLTLTRNYFPNDTHLAANAQPGTNLLRPGPEANAGVPVTRLETQIRELGLRAADSNLVQQLFQDPRRDQDGIVFVDARDAEHYQAGHIPGAYQLDYYHKEDYLAAVLPACLAAQTVLVYCAGGACEDSLLTASVVLAPVVPKEKLFVYEGGFTEWTNNRLPVELGQRRSGRMLEAPR